MAGCVFCAVVAGTTQSHLIAGTDDEVAFLDTRPVFPGHVLVVPRVHVETLADLPSQSLGGFFRFVQRISNAVERGLGAGGTFVAINNRVSQSVPHLHAHVIPRTKGDGLRGFFWPRTRYASTAVAAGYRDQIAAALAAQSPADQA